MAGMSSKEKQRIARLWGENTHWSLSRLAERTGYCRATVTRVLRSLGIDPRNRFDNRRNEQKERNTVIRALTTGDDAQSYARVGGRFQLTKQRVFQIKNL